MQIVFVFDSKNLDRRQKKTLYSLCHIHTHTHEIDPEWSEKRIKKMKFSLPKKNIEKREREIERKSVFEPHTHTHTHTHT